MEGTNMPISLFEDAANWMADAATDAVDWAGQAAEDAANAVADAATEAANAVAEAAEEAAEWAEQAAEDIGDGLEDLGEIYVEGFKAIGEELDEAFSKEGWMTTFMEEYFPGGGLITAGVHMAAGNEDYAQAAAVKGLVTALEASASIAGTLALGPVGGVLAAGIGNGLGQLIEIGLMDELPDSVQHLFPPKSLEGTLMEMGSAMLGGAVGAGAGKAGGAVSRAWSNAGKSAAEIAARQAAKEAVETTTTRLVLTAVGKKMAFSILKPVNETLLDEAGIPITRRRLSVGESQALSAALASRRHLAEIEGASPEELRDYDQQIFSAMTKTNDLQNDGEDLGQFDTYQHENLGEYYMRDGVIVWKVEEIAEANKDIELDRVGMTEEEVEKFIEDQWKQRFSDYGAEHPDWEVVHDPILGDYMVKEGKVVFGTTDPAAAQVKYATDTAQDRGFASVEEYKDELINSWQIAHQYAEEAGTATGKWEVGGQSDIVGDYMIKDGQVVFGATTPEEADVMLPNQLAKEQGYDGVDAMREELERDWRLANVYNKECGYDVDGWQEGGQSDIVGPYMIKDGVVVWGAEDEEQAEQYLPNQLAVNQGFSGIDAMKEELVNSWKVSHEYDVESGTETGEWQAGGQSEIVGPYMIKDGEVVFGARTPEEAEAIMAGEMVPPGQEEQIDFDDVEYELPEEVAVDEHGNPIFMTDDDESGDTPEEDLTIGDLRAQIEALQQQIEDLSERLEETSDDDEISDDEISDDEKADAHEEGINHEMSDDDDMDDDGFDNFDDMEPELPEEVAINADGTPVNPPDDASTGLKAAVMPEDGFDNFDGMEPELPEEMAINADGTPVNPPDDASTEFKPAVMPEDPMHWDAATPGQPGETAPEYFSAVMPDGANASDPVHDAEQFSDQHNGATPAEPTEEPSEEQLTFHEPTVDPMNDPMNDPMLNPMLNPEEEPNC